ncbi:hypothetical protein HYPSUDRAFT_50960 [Hypholoma sublateritium FD-334 SS-4]|uniref:Uncharacterized protein n=1 Tax=Hypholoma sublateritium (strain FD-334 SS-4) TaxID=945553 RepID=A0A0D2LLG7_HYPSF|nr:hypothetical protein HYPSUDRAFT_50960 [Hypholoma sublateritium FD-334 SS-4]
MADTLPELDGSNKENDAGLTITAPVPLSYAARSKAALKSILSTGNEAICSEDMAREGDTQRAAYTHLPEAHGGDGSMSMGIDQLNAFAEQLVHALEQQEEARAPPLAAIDGTTRHGPREVTPARPPMIVRPISASTLIALTEPCLMAWCCDPESDFLNTTVVPIVSNPWPAAMTVVGQNGAGTIGDRVNSWGY